MMLLCFVNIFFIILRTMFMYSMEKLLNVFFLFRDVTLFSIILSYFLIIEEVDDIKYLGLFVEIGLTWKKHTDYVKNKLICQNFLHAELCMQI